MGSTIPIDPIVRARIATKFETFVSGKGIGREGRSSLAKHYTGDERSRGIFCMKSEAGDPVGKEPKRSRLDTASVDAWRSRPLGLL